jgi:hypothetical protein
MAAAAEIVRPGVEVIQEIRTVSPTILAPTLAPCIIGVCKQIVEVLDSDGTVNSDALTSASAVATAENSQASYNLNGTSLTLSVSEGPEQTFSFAGTDPFTAVAAAAAINGSTPAPSGFTAYAVNVGTEASPDWRLQLRTTAAGATASIRLIGGTALSPLGWASRTGWTYYGIGAYQNYAAYLPQTSLPDPRDIMDELDVEEDTIRAFVDLGTEVREFLRSETFLRNGTTIAVVDDGDGDATTPFVNVSESLIAAATAAVTGVGTVDLSADVEIHGETLILSVDGESLQTLDIIGQPIVSTDSTGWTFTNIQGNTLIMSVNGTAVTVTFGGAVATLAEVISDINTQVAALVGSGTVVAYAAGQWGDVDAGGTYLGLFFGGAPPTVVANTEVEVTGGTAATEILGAATAKQVNRAEKQNASQPIGGINDQIDALWGGSLAFLDGSNYLYLESSTVGSESVIFVDSSSTSLTTLGFDLQAGRHVGGSFPVRLGDAVYADGEWIGDVTQIHSGGTVGKMKLSQESSTSATWSTWYIIAKNLDLQDSSTYGVTYPTPDLFINTQGDIQIKHDVLRDTSGDPVTLSAGVNLYHAYSALRLDVSADASNPALLAFGDSTELEAALAPVTPDNPLAYGLFLALQNAGTNYVYGIGVGAISDDAPYGTETAWQSALDFLEAKDVYGLAFLTDDSTILQAGRTHVLAMSEPEEKGERVMYCWLGRPTRASDTIVVSGTDGDRLSTTTFDTKVATLTQALLAQGIDPNAITVDDDVYLDIGSDSINYNIGSVSGTVVTVNKTFAADENTDGFYTETENLPTTAISDVFSVKIRGAAIPSTTAGKATEISTIVARGEGFASRRVRMQQCDQVQVSVSGVAQLVEGFYICAAKAGQVAGNSPAQPYTEFPITGFSGVTGSNDIYKPSQMNQGAAGGAEWIIQEGDGAPLKSRHQLTTDTTSIEVREQSITNALDYGSKLLRAIMRFYIGRFNISDTYLETLSAVGQAGLEYIVDKRVWAGGDLNNLLQDETNPDTILMDVTVTPFYPANRIRITLIV